MTEETGKAEDGAQSSAESRAENAKAEQAAADKKAATEKSAKSAKKKSSAKKAAKPAAAKSEEKSQDQSDLPPTPPPAAKPASNMNPGSLAAAFGAGLVAAVVVVMLAQTTGLGAGDRAARSDVAELQAQVDRMALASGDTEAVGRLQVRLDGIEEDLRALNAGAARAADLAAAEQSLQDTRERLAILENNSSRRTGTASGSADLDVAVAGLDERVTTFAADVERALTTVNARIATLEGRVPDNLQAELEALVAENDFAALATRVTVLEDDQLAQDMRRAALALSLAQLSRAAQGSDPFAAELEALAALRPDDTYVQQLRSIAQAGVPTEAMLTSAFSSVRRQVIAEYNAARYDGWFASVWHWITSRVTFQRTGRIEGDGVEAILARAELRLEENNLSATVQEIASLPEDVRNPAEDWLTMAAARVSLNRLITALSTEVIGELEQ